MVNSVSCSQALPADASHAECELQQSTANASHAQSSSSRGTAASSLREKPTSSRHSLLGLASPGSQHTALAPLEMNTTQFQLLPMHLLCIQFAVG